MIAHFAIPKSICVHLQYLSNLSNWIYSDVSLFAITPRSYTYIGEFIVILDVPSM